MFSQLVRVQCHSNVILVGRAGWTEIWSAGLSVTDPLMGRRPRGGKRFLPCIYQAAV
jgi:hypothetical protein